MRTLTAAILLLVLPATSWPAEEASLELHGQATYLRQWKPSFPASYSGPNSLEAGKASTYTFTSTLFLGARLGDTELYYNPEFIQGTAFSGLHGLGGFSNGENQRGGTTQIRGYRARLFARHTWNLGGEMEEQKSEQNQVKTSYSARRFVLTAGNVSTLDIFDAMDYSHDARTQFMNWSSLTYGAFDYPADARGYTWGVAGEYITPEYQVRAGRFLVPVESNGLRLDWTFMRRYGDVAELELPYKLDARPGIFRFLVFRNRVTAGDYTEALAAPRAAGAAPDVANVRTAQTKTGFGISTQLEVSENVGGYVRAGWSDGRTETFMFTEIDRSLSAGILLKGAAWRRAEDRLGVAGYLNGLSRAHRSYLAAGGLGFFLGDGRLNYATERIVEVFYSLNVAKGTFLSAGYQRVWNPGYNRDRGPAEFYSVRAHYEF